MCEATTQRAMVLEANAVDSAPFSDAIDAEVARLHGMVSFLFLVAAGTEESSTF